MNELEDPSQLEELIHKLEAKPALAKMYDPSQDVGMSKHVLNHCEEVESLTGCLIGTEKCASAGRALAQSAKLQALIEEGKRRMTLLNGLSEATQE